MKDDKKIMDEIIDFLLHSLDTGTELIAAASGSELAKKNILTKARSLLKETGIEYGRVETILDDIKKFLWGYFILEPFIDEKMISDIRVMAYDKISVCCNGIYKMTGLSFDSKAEYESFMQSIAVMNQISLADINALQIVTDKTSNKDWILRIAIATEYLNSDSTYFLHIRKHPRLKKSFNDLVKTGMIPESMSDYLKSRVGKGMLVAGRTGSGKTHFTNAMIDLIPEYEPGICVQESEELFSSRKNSLITFLHVVLKRGEGKIQYNLEDLSKFGLLTSNKYFIIGEIKGNEAEFFANACYTGMITWTTVHSESSVDAIDKLCDYVMRATGYEQKFVKKMLKSLETVVYIENYKIREISEIAGYDADTGEILYKTIYREVKA